MIRVARFDRCVRFDVLETAAAVLPPSPERGIATWTAEGYLVIDAFTARDGLLEYSDGESSWTEYRSRAELEAAAPTFRGAPVTHQHPDAMVSAATWAEVARGHGIGEPAVTDPIGGVSYLRDRLLVTDAELLSAIRDGLREISIGFTSRVVPAIDGAAPDGTRCDAVQEAIVGNHNAIVDRGRAGPACRLPLQDSRESVSVGRFDRSAWCNYSGENDMKNRNKHDEAGAPTEMVEIPAPDGSSVSVPTWIAAALQELEQLRAQAQAPAQPATPAAPAVPATPAAPVPAPGDAEAEEKEEPESKDAIAELVKRRARYERLAVRAGLEDAKIDSLDDDALAREIVAVRMPWAKDQAATVRGDALDALVSAAAAVPVDRQTKNDRSGSAMRYTVPHSDGDADTAVEAEANYLKSQGYDL